MINAMNPEPSGTRMSTEEMKAFLRNHLGTLVYVLLICTAQWRASGDAGRRYSDRATRCYLC
jgi:hypothetical protein